MDQTARELIRALRGSRSQVAFSRRLGYRSNVAADWEQGRRFPTASETLRAATVVGIDVAAAFTTFHPDAGVPEGAQGIAEWLDGQRGTTSVREVADRMGHSRHAVGRWLRGDSEPRLPDFLSLVAALTGRLPDWVASLVSIDLVPSQAGAHESMLRSRRVGIEHPWTIVVMLALETEGYKQLNRHDDDALAAMLGLEVDLVRSCLTELVAAGVVGASKGRFIVEGSLTIDTKAIPDAWARLRAFWAEVAATRAVELKEQDLMSYNLFNVSTADLERIRELQRAFFREVRGIVAASESPEQVALLNVQLMTWGA